MIFTCRDGSFWYSYIEFDYTDCIWVYNEYSVAGNSNCDDTTVNGKVPVVNQNYDQLNHCEKPLAKKYAPQAFLISRNIAKAHNATQALFGAYNNSGNGHNDCADAFRHTYFNALNTMVVGEYLTKAFGDAHECDTPDNLVLEKEMDLHNNAIGIELGLNYPSATDSQLADLVLQKMKYGQLRFLTPLNSNNEIQSNSNLVPTFEGCQR